MTLLTDSDFFDKTPWWILLVVLMLNSLILRGQKLPPVEVANLTLKVGGLSAKEFYYGFAEGDEILFSFEEKRGKKVKEVEIIELPGSSKFMDYRSTKVEQKKIKVYKKGIYRFRFTNSALGKRVCKVHIQRIPASEALIAFNTDWQWETRYDTSFVPYTEDSLVGYDTVYIQKVKKVLVKTDTLFTELLNKDERVHSATAYGKTQYSYITFSLPNNTYRPNLINPYRSTEVLAWSYWIGVGNEALENYDKANRSLKDGILGIGSITGNGALAALAVSGVSLFTPPPIGDNVSYELSYSQNGHKKIIDSGNGRGASGRNTRVLHGAISIQLYNDNFKDGINTTIKVMLVQVQKKWEDREYTERNIKPKYTTLHKQRMIVNHEEIRVNAE